MKKFGGKSVVLGISVLMAIVGATVSMAQERPERGPGARGPGMRGPGMRGAAMGGPGLAQNFDQVDKNSDGKITKDEFANWIWERISRADANQDGALAKAEVENMRPPGREGGPPGGVRASGEGRRGPGEGARAGGEGRRGPGRQGRSGQGPGGTISFESKALAKDEAEKKILDVLDNLDKNQRRGNMNVPVEDGRLLRLLAETLGAKHVVEIGTSNGYSGIWQSLALRKTGGKLTTYEIDARRASLARENFKRAGVEKIVTLVEGDAHEEVTKLKDPIDILFLDADKEGYIDYLEKLVPLVRPGGLIIAHNMNQRQADPKFVKAITTNKDMETLFLHMQGAGVSVSMKKR